MCYRKEKLSDTCNIYFQDERYEQLIQEVVNLLLKNKKSGDKIEIVKEKLTPSKDGKKRNIEVYKFNYKSEEYYIKHFYQRRLSKRILRLFLGPQGLNNFKTGTKLKKENIPCAVSIGCISYKDNFFDIDSISISKALEGLNLLETLRNAERENISINRIKIAKQLGHICAQLVNNNYYHKDPNPQNFICENTTDPLIYIIDFDSLFHFSYLPLNQIIHFIARISAKFYVWFISKDLEPPSKLEKKAFIKAFFRKFNRKVKFRIFMNKVNKLTEKKILNRIN